MIETFHCPNCHAALEADPTSHQTTVRCPFCNTTVIVPEALRPSAPVTGSNPDQSQALSEVISLLHTGNKIGAIKRFRETFNVGLKEAKEAVEKLERREVLDLSQFSRPALASSGAPAMVVTPTPATGTRGRARFVTCLVVAIVALIGLSILIPLAGGVAIWRVVRSEVEPTLMSSLGDISTTVIQAAVSPTSAATRAIPSPTPAFAVILSQFGGQVGSGPGFFDDTRRLGLDGEGRIYTGDYSGGRVQVFDAGGQFLALWLTGSDAPMTGLAVDRTGLVYILQGGRIKRFVGLTGEAQGEVATGKSYFDTLASGPDGSLLAVADNRLLRLDSRGGVILDISDPFAAIPDFATTHRDATLDGAGNVYILGSETIYRFTPDGRFAGRIGSLGDGPDQFMTSPTALAVDGQGRIYANDFKGILVFDPDGRYLGLIDLPGVTFDMAVNDHNELVVMDRNSNAVITYRLNP